MVGMILASMATGYLGHGDEDGPAEILRLSLMTLFCGLVGYLLYGLGWLNVRDWPVVGMAIPADASDRWDALAIGFFSALIPPWLLLLWDRIRTRRTRRRFM